MAQTAPWLTSSWWRARVSARLSGLPLDRPGVLAAAVIGVGAVVGALVVVVSLRGSPPPVEMNLPRAGPPSTSSSGPAGPEAASRSDGPDSKVFVYAAGAVVRSGVYQVPAGARVTDVVDAAGGPAPDADLQQLNLAAKVADGERVYVPRRGETPPTPVGPGTGDSGTGGSTSSGSANGPVNLNTATLDQLETLPGVGPATAQAILDYRKEHGRFANVDELIEVRGIGEAKLAALRPKVRV